jgi:hypothetical protein
MIQKLLDRLTRRVLFEAEIVADADTSGGVRLGLAVKLALKAGADLGGAYLRGADLRVADLRGAYLRGADLRGADLRGADLGGAYLGGAYLGGADLRGAYLRGADLGGADLGGAYLGGVRWGEGAKWREGVLVTREPILLLLPGVPHRVTILDRHIEVGCQLHEIAAWAAMGEAAIVEMDGARGVEMWRTWREPVLAVARAAGRPLTDECERERGTAA